VYLSFLVTEIEQIVKKWLTANKDIAKNKVAVVWYTVNMTKSAHKITADLLVESL